MAYVPYILPVAFVLLVVWPLLTFLRARHILPGLFAEEWQDHVAKYYVVLLCSIGALALGVWSSPALWSSFTQFLFIVLFIFVAVVLAYGLLLGIAIISWTRWMKNTLVGFCRQCGYNLKGNVTGRCPECGKRVFDPD